jgi:hypothetical protein
MSACHDKGDPIMAGFRVLADLSEEAHPFQKLPLVPNPELALFVCSLNWNRFYLFVPKPEHLKCVCTTHALLG